jgi:homoserine trans-succinylase
MNFGQIFARAISSLFLPYAYVRYINFVRNAIAWNKIHIASTVGLSWIIRTILFH